MEEQAQDKKRKAVIHCCIDGEILAMLERHCEKTGQTKTTAIKRAIRAYCGENSNNSNKGAGGDG